MRGLRLVRAVVVREGGKFGLSPTPSFIPSQLYKERKLVDIWSGWGKSQGMERGRE